MYGQFYFSLCLNLQTFTSKRTCTEELQRLEHCWLIYHGYFKLVLESLIKQKPIAADIIKIEIISGDFHFDSDKGILFIFIRIVSMRRF